MTVSVGTREAIDRLPELLDRVEKGEEVAITREGRTVARLVPGAADGSSAPKAGKEALRALADRFSALENAKTGDRDPDRLDLDRLRRLSDQFVEHFGRPFRSTDIDALLYDEDGLPR